MEKFNKRNVLALLRAGRKVLNSQDKLVHDWNNILEFNGEQVFDDDNGNFYYYDFREEEDDDRIFVDVTHCKACIIGGIDLACIGRYTIGERDYAQNILVEQTTRLYNRSISQTFNIAEVHAVYDAAIADLEN